MQLGGMKLDAKTKEAMFNLRDTLKEGDTSSQKVGVWRSDLEAVMNHLFFSGGEWSNQSAYGYAIAATEQSGMNSKDVQKLVNAMRIEFDEMTLEQAADVYRKSNY